LYIPQHLHPLDATQGFGLTKTSKSNREEELSKALKERNLNSYMNRKDILNKAIELTYGDRDKDYGDPYDNMLRTAKLWSTYLGVDIRPDQVAILFTLAKISRLANTPEHLDSFIDSAAYMAIAAEVGKSTVKGLTPTREDLQSNKNLFTF